MEPTSYYQGALVVTPWHGFSDFLLRVNGVCRRLFGDFAYDVADTKLAQNRRGRSTYVQLCVYAGIFSARSQGIDPPWCTSSSEMAPKVSVAHLDSPPLLRRHAEGRFELFVGAPSATPTAEPCGHCPFAAGKQTCEDPVGGRSEHLSLVANINRSQIDKLRAGGVKIRCTSSRR